MAWKSARWRYPIINDNLEATCLLQQRLLSSLHVNPRPVISTSACDSLDCRSEIHKHWRPVIGDHYVSGFSFVCGWTYAGFISL